MDRFDPERHPHRRRNPLTGDSILVSPQRTDRPWLGEVQPAPPAKRSAYDPACYLCPGNRRAGGEVNPSYERTFAFDNDFPALIGESPTAGASDDEFFATEVVHGACRVVCFSPRHDLSLAEMDASSLLAVVDRWAAETAALGRLYPWVQVFENKGAAMGCSNLHPHGQVWASSFVPNEAVVEDDRQRRYADRVGSPLLVDYAHREIDRGVRIVLANADWLAVVPYWAIWPYEVLVIPRRSVPGLPELHASERIALAELLGDLLGGYDDLFGVSVPYSMGWHGAPHAPGAVDHWQLHAHIYPPLLRSAAVRKYMVGYEMLAEPQRDLTPERAAERLRDSVVRRNVAAT